MYFVEVNRAARANGQTLGRTAFIVFTRGKDEDSPQPSTEKVRQKNEQSPSGSFPEKTATQGRTWLVRTKENITMAPYCRQVVLAHLDFEKVKVTLR
jgi:hypothetical protein